MATCAISGNVPEEPVVSIKTGHLFEKRLIVKYINSTGLCPVTQTPLAMEDLIDVKVAGPVSKPRAPSLTTFPALLNSLQEEWDNVLLETFTLKQQVDGLKHELALSLYQQDASNRVIARLLRERDEARAALANVDANVKSIMKPTSDSVMSDNTTSAAETTAVQAQVSSNTTQLPESYVTRIKDVYSTLMANRKAIRKERPTMVLPSSTLSQFTLRDSSPIAGTESGISSMVHHGSLVIMGCVDGTIVVFDRTTSTVVCSVLDHSSNVFAVSVAEDTINQQFILASSSANRTVTYKLDSNLVKLAEISSKSEITGLALHPSGSFVVTCSNTGAWYTHDALSGALLRTCVTENQLSAVSFHPDGQYVALGTTQGLILVVDVMDGSNVGTIQADGKINCIAFSENGTHFAIGTSISASYWDLRKSTMVGSLPAKGAITAVAIDYSGTLLMDASGANGVRVTTVKNWETITHSTVDTSGPITSLAFGPKAEYMLFATQKPNASLYTLSN